MDLFSHFSDTLETLGGFEENPLLAVAVSGGADSMALCLLANKWASARKGKVIALTVNHQLRAEASDEAKRVGAWLARHHIEHHVLTWQSPAGSNVQHAAREARYALLENFCRVKGILHLLIGHHRDDQVETLMQRTWRGSGVDGLAGMAPLRETDYVRLLRPLLAVSKHQLEAFLKQEKQLWVEDPSNRSPDYERSRLRKHIAEFEDESPAENLLQSAQGMAVARVALEQRTANWLTQYVEVSPCGFALMDEAAFRSVESEISLRALSALLTTISGEAYPPRHEKLVQLHQSLCNPTPAKKLTLSGCLLSRSQGTGRRYWLISREPRAVQLPVPLTSHSICEWDKRFRISLDGTKMKGLKLGALGPAGVTALRKQHVKLPKYPHFLLSTFPALWQIDKVIAVPHIEYAHAGFNGSLDIVFKPAKPLAAASFYITLNGSNKPKVVHA